MNILVVVLGFPFLLVLLFLFVGYMLFCPLQFLQCFFQSTCGFVFADYDSMLKDISYKL